MYSKYRQSVSGCRDITNNWWEREYNIVLINLMVAVIERDYDNGDESIGDEGMISYQCAWVVVERIVTCRWETKN